MPKFKNHLFKNPTNSTNFDLINIYYSKLNLKAAIQHHYFIINFLKKMNAFTEYPPCFKSRYNHFYHSLFYLGNFYVY